MHCPVCQQGKEFELVEKHSAKFKGDILNYEIYKCDFCGSSFADPLKSAPSDYYDYGVPDWRWEFGQLVDYLDELHENQSDSKLNVLEIGCNEGNLLEKIDITKCEILGIDFNHLAIKKAQDKGLNCHVLTIEQIKEKYPDTYFDVICFFHVLEHLENPSIFLKSVRSLLKVNGKIIFSVPHPRRLTSLTKGEIGDYPPHHIIRFSVQGIKYLCSNMSLNAFLFKDHPQDTNLLKFLSLSTYGFMKRVKLDKVYNSELLPRLLKVVIKLPFSLLIIPYATIAYLTHLNLPGSALYVVSEIKK